MNKFQRYTVTVYDEDEDWNTYPIGEVDIRAEDFCRAEEIAQLMFDNTGRVISVEENNGD